MKKENTSFNNAVHLLIEGRGTPKNRSKNDGGTPEKEENRGTPDKNIPKTDYESIEEMANLMRVPTGQLLSCVKDLLERGELYYSKGKLRNPRYEEFEDICSEKKLNADGLMYKFVRDIENGK